MRNMVAVCASLPSVAHRLAAGEIRVHGPRDVATVGGRPKQGGRFTLWFLLALVAAFGALPGCAAGHTVGRDEAPQLTDNQGFIVMVVDSDRRITITLCRDAGTMHCAEFGPLTPEDAMAVSQVAAGLYCISHVVADPIKKGNGISDAFEADDTTCFQVAPGVVTYPGHLVYRVDKMLSYHIGASGGWVKRDHIKSELRFKYPKLAKWPLRTVPTFGFE